MIENVSKKNGVDPAVPMIHRPKMMVNRSLSIFVMKGPKAIIITIAICGADNKYSTHMQECPVK